MSQLLTGNTRHRVNWRNKVIMEVEFWQWYMPAPIRLSLFDPKLGRFVRRWRDATGEDARAIDNGQITTEQPPGWSYPPPPKPKSVAQKPKELEQWTKAS